MRERGAMMTDLVVLIVSATEGVKKQTSEVIKIINEKKIPCIVAINKIDLPNADTESTERSLHEAGLEI
jgi:translation initiation factor IF-2